MFNSFIINLKDKYQNSSTWTDLLFALTGLDKQLADAQTDKERVKILHQIVSAQQKQLRLLDEENEKLKNQLKDKEETANEKLSKFLDEIKKLEQEKQELEIKINNMSNSLTKALKELQAKLNEKIQQIMDLNNHVKKLKKELEEVKKERDELKDYKTNKEIEEQEALKILGEIDTSIDETFANIEIPPK